MASRREVDVNRPEHSWIPFYRELAEKLVNDGWRDRQGEVVGVLQRLRSEGVPIHGLVDNLTDHIDPFTVFAMFSRGISFENMLRVMDGLKSEFGMTKDLPREQPFIPYANNMTVGYFWGYEDISDDIETLWDVFAKIMKIESLEDLTDVLTLREDVEQGLRVKGVGISKLTSGFYWVSPRYFLHSDTVDAVGGVDLGIRSTNADAYLKCLIRTWEMSEESFPEVNIRVFKTQNPNWDPPNLWLIRADQGNKLSGVFRSGDYVGFNFSFDDKPLLEFTTATEAEKVIRSHRPYRTDHAVRQMLDFLLGIKIGDYVLMPDMDRDLVHYGTVASDPYYGEDGSHKNRRQIQWSDDRLRRDALGLIGRAYGATVNEVKGDLKKRFFDLKDRNDGVVNKVEFELPEDSWVPLHLEVGRKLVKDKWWMTEKRDELAQVIDDIRWADPEDVGEDYVYERWTGDPFSFYLSFNLRSTGSMRIPAYAKVKELFGLESKVPGPEHIALGYGVHGGFGRSPSDTEITTLWECFRLVQQHDPIDDPEVGEQFVDYFDRLVAADAFVGLRNRKLSYWLHWIDPTRYVYIEQLSKLGIVAELGLASDCGNGSGYLNALARARALAEAHDLSLVALNRWGTTRETLGIGPVATELPTPYGMNDMLKEGLFFKEVELRRILERFADKKNLILQGPPGVGKTFVTRRLAYAVMGVQDDDRIVNAQFHQSYSYEEFVRGYRPRVNESEELVFKMEDGAFLRLCDAALDDSDRDYVMIIDEINRGNLSRVFGELLSLIEKDKRGGDFKVTLAGGDEFSVPENVYLLGTMNLADRSLAGMDYAMRRRFAFVTLEPQFGEKGDEFKKWLRTREVPEGMITRINDRMSALNEVIAGDASLGRNFAVGHSYFCDIADGGEEDWDRWYREIVETEIKPLLEEYWFDDLKKADDEVVKLLDGVAESS